MLDAFLESSALRPFVDGETDCALTVADWVEAVTGIDPAAHLRGRYKTALGRERLLRKLGGLEAVMADCAARAGLQETGSPGRGDIGLICLASGVEIAGICTGRLWSMASSDGHLAIRGEVMRAWRVDA